MWLKCITRTVMSNLGHRLAMNITLNVSYKVIDTNNVGYNIINDLGKTGWYVKDYFEPIEEMRNDKLKKLGL